MSVTYEIRRPPTKKRSNRYLIVRPGKYHSGLDVGWGFGDDPTRLTWEHMWGQVKTDANLTMLCVELRNRGWDFQVYRSGV